MFRDRGLGIKVVLRFSLWVRKGAVQHSNIAGIAVFAPHLSVSHTKNPKQVEEKGGRTFTCLPSETHKLSTARQAGVQSFSFTHKGYLGLTGSQDTRVSHLTLAIQWQI